MLAKEKTRETFVQAVKYFKDALQHDPNYSLAYACLGFGYMFDYQNRWTEDPDGSLPAVRSALDQAASAGHSCACSSGPSESLKSRNLSVLGPDRMDNLSKAHS